MDREIEINNWLEQDKNNFVLEKSSKLYPELLTHIPNAPELLFVKGKKEILNLPCISIVGARKPLASSNHYLKKIIKNLENKNITIVSGLAIGIDTLAHKYSLENMLPTIAVLPCGINKIYPQRNTQLANQIIENGLILSEFMPDIPARKHHFLQRNRIVTGLSQMLLVVQAKTKSGTMSSANHALEQNREVLVIPSEFNNELSTGNFELIQSGAYCLSSVSEAVNIISKQAIHN